MYAAGPYTYNHLTGGGAVNDATIGRDQDVVNSLEGGDYRCNDLVSHFIVLRMASSVSRTTQCADVVNSLTADSTGATGVGYTDIRNIVVQDNCGGHKWENGAGNSSCANLGKGKFGRECGYVGNCNEDITVLPNSPSFPYAPPLSGTNQAQLVFSFRVCGLEKNEIIVVRYDAVISCKAGTRPTGNIQANIVSLTNYPCGAGDSCSQSVQDNIPLKGVQNIDGVLGCSPVGPNSIQFPDFNATVTVYPSGGLGGSYQELLWYSWSQGEYKLQNPNDPTDVEVHTFDVTCSFLHNGITTYTTTCNCGSACSCEPTFISSTQPQLFFNPNSTYFNSSYTIETLDGIVVKHYVRSSTDSVVTDLYINNNNGAIYEALFQNGDKWIFSNVKSGPIPPSTFTVQNISTCRCNRTVDVIVVLERTERISRLDFASTILFVRNFADGFAYFGSSRTYYNALIGVYWYDATLSKTLTLNQGTNYLQVANAVGTIGCKTANGANTDPCGNNYASGGTPLAYFLSNAIRTATNDLVASTRTNSEKIILLVNRGSLPDTLSNVAAATQYAQSNSVTVLSVMYTPVEGISNNQNAQATGGLAENFWVRWDDNELAQLNTNWPAPVSARMCSLVPPCGGSCCGKCSACSTCEPPTSCPTTSNCSSIYEIVGGCCTLVSRTGVCTKQPNTCQSVACNATSGDCYIVSNNTCGQGANDKNCFDYQCDTTGGCVKTPKWTNNKCFTFGCVGNAIVVNQTTSCPADTNCFTFACVNSSGCVSTARTNPISNKCQTCVESQGGFVNTTTCPGDTSFCFPEQCDPATGTCQRLTPPVCNHVSNLCDLSYCNETQKKCVNVTKTCSNGGDQCITSRCQPSTGLCQNLTKQCPINEGCTCGVAQDCNSTTGNCDCRNDPAECPTPAPTSAPTRQPTRGPTSAPTEEPTEAPNSPPTTKRPTKAPTNFPTDAPTGAPTNTPAPTPNNCVCPSTLCINSHCTDPVTGTCTNTSVNCSDVLSNLASDTCITITGCDDTQGCLFNETTCGPPSNNCSSVIKNSSAPGCCVEVPKICPTDACYSYTCNPASGECVPTPKCPDNNKCFDITCDPQVGFGCIYTPVTCQAPSLCHTSSCDNNTGCVFTPKTCDDSNACTSDTCDTATGNCTYVDHSSDCDSTDPCHLGSCNSTTGDCIFVDVICDDGIDCTEDTCVAGVGCQYQPLDERCLNYDGCSNNGTCNVTVGCVALPLVCPNASSYCLLASCVPFVNRENGCTLQPRDCGGNYSNTSCDTYNCSEQNRTCTKKTSACFSFIGIVAGIVVGGVIGGVLGAAAILALATSSGAAYAISVTRDNDQEHKVRVNPIYHGQGKGNEVHIG